MALREVGTPVDTLVVRSAGTDLRSQEKRSRNASISWKICFVDKGLGTLSFAGNGICKMEGFN